MAAWQVTGRPDVPLVRPSAGQPRACDGLQIKVLLVEDDFGVGRFVTRGLAAEGVTVIWLRTGAQVADTVRSEDCDAILLDVGLPDVDGYALCHALRGQGLSTPIIIVTARDALAERLRGFEAGADDYLSKPFAFEELVARLRAVTRRGRADSITRMGQLSLDRRARTANVAGHNLPLSRREFDVLVSLADGRGRAVSRDELIDRAWGVNAEIYENTVDVYIGYLRRRLSRIGSAVVIETVRGAGFRLVDKA